MRPRPAKPLIPRRRKLPFRQNHLSRYDSSDSGSAASQRFPDGIHILDHASVSDTQVDVIPKQGVLTAEGKECGVQGPSKFLPLSGSHCHPAAEADGSVEQLLKAEPGVNKDPDWAPLDGSITDIQWLSRISTFALEPDPAKEENDNKENQNPSSQEQDAHAEAADHLLLEKPPYSYMVMIQFAINSNQKRRMTLKEIYMWIEDHFPYFRQAVKPGWKNSIRHNLSLHDMFIREISQDDNVSYWTIRPEANRCLTLDQVTKQQKRELPDPRETPGGSERRIRHLLPRSDSSSVPIQLPVASSVHLPSSSAQFPSSCSEQKQNTSQGVMRMWISPKVAQGDALALVMYPQESKDLRMKVKEEPLCILMKCQTPKSIQKRHGSRLRRKQQLIPFREEEPILLWPDNTENRSSPLTSSRPSKPPSNVLAETRKFTPVAKVGQSILNSKHIHTPDGPVAPVWNDYTTFSFSSTPFKNWPLLNSPREPLSVTPSRANRPAVSPTERLRNSCSRELLQAGGSTSANHSHTEDLMLDTMNVSLSKILDISFSGLDDEDLGTANISWSDYFP